MFLPFLTNKGFLEGMIRLSSIIHHVGQMLHSRGTEPVIGFRTKHVGGGRRTEEFTPSVEDLNKRGGEAVN